MPEDTKLKSYTYNIEFDPLEVITKGGNEKKYYVEGYFSTIDEDLAMETLTPKAQKDILRQVKGRTITFDVEHEVFYDKHGHPKAKPASSITVGKVVEAELRTKGVWGRVELNTSSPRFKNIWESIKKGFLHSFSVAFYPLEAVKRKVNGVMKSFVNSLNLLNITLTGCPVNPEAKFNAVMKSAVSGFVDSFGDENMDTQIDLKHKYYKREGRPGHYTYYYKDKQGNITSSNDAGKKESKPTKTTENLQSLKELSEEVSNSDLQGVVGAFAKDVSGSKNESMEDDILDYLHGKMKLDKLLDNHPKLHDYKEPSKKSYTYQNIDNTNKTTNNEVNSMVEDINVEEPKVQVKETKDEPTKAKPEVKTEDNVSNNKDNEVEMKSQIAAVLKSNTELKASNESLAAELKAVKEEIEKLKAKPVIKGLKETMKIAPVNQEQEISPLALIK